MSWIKNSLTFVISISLSLLIAEMCFRHFDLGYGNAPLEKSLVFHHRHPTDYEFTVYDPTGEYGGHQVYYDQSGLRATLDTMQSGSENDTSDGLIFLGDSFTEGNQVPYQNTFAYLTGQALGVSTLNFGVSSYSPIIYRLQAKYMLPTLPESRVILQLFSNDFADDRAYEKSSIYKDDEIVAIDGGENNWMVSLLRQSHIVRFLRKSYVIIKLEFNNREKLSTDSNIVFEIEQNVQNQDINNSVEILTDIQEILNTQGKSLTVFLMPSKFLTKKGICCAGDRLYQRVTLALASRRIEFIDIANEFGKFKDQDNLFFSRDIHMTKIGHDLVAKQIANHLTHSSSIKKIK